MTGRPPWREVARATLREALRVRSAAQVPFSEPLNVFDLAANMGVEVRFVDIGSLEGMYWAGPTPRIFIAADRPAGRQAFTCGHELGHHVFGHGTRLDELVSDTAAAKHRDPEELLADTFSGFLLMPRRAVSAGFARRCWDPHRYRPEEYYVVATWLGVGYTTLLNHMARSLGMITSARATALTRATPKEIRRQLVGSDVPHDLLIVNSAWTGRPVDMRVGDWMLIPPETAVHGSNLALVASTPDGTLLSAERSGCGRLYNPVTEDALFFRISRMRYVGLGSFRHLEEPEQ